MTAAKRGLVMVITGDGKGKTTAAFGQALRAVGQGYSVCIIQFMKGRKYGEVLAAEKYLPAITVIQSGLDSFVMRDSPAKEDIALARQGFAKAQEIILGKRYDMVILDEINVAVDFNLISEQAVLELIHNKPPAVDLLLTGRYASAKIREIADTVSEIAEIKHHYYAGVRERAGIEY
ncbi:cob(I)yrinic acid a,c-diamide adenosyltransferase [Sporomusa acidovorans]|uniref:Corrinoid adenosyltransferase n=1 Tax=Sporomusa acidovorans (strain ATCC 49682 / DSM 3132 / Mol) TaxID=1123286 RepID=A0ABZ3J633_SPOA4|nr:cob(I)yrinic acid a,c-diamide adenosyltransferase [Sporomusa acidovorans]OZC12941.1 Cob(I)yrinic acid a,c-diamide adenosyltransferase [Sporomusa acidovorans DSM 3132]SDF13015.1 cob(I)yrinic acid a,c-diamide adenosyltransferase [Sporomusa acidovorans]